MLVICENPLRGWKPSRSVASGIVIIGFALLTNRMIMSITSLFVNIIWHFFIGGPDTFDIRITFFFNVILFDVHVTIHHVKFLIIKPTRCTNFSNLFLLWNSACFRQFLCPSSGVFHCTHSNGICHRGLLTACKQD